MQGIARRHDAADLEVATLRAQLCAAQSGDAATYRDALAWVARRAGEGARGEATVQAALRLVHAMRHTYDPARDPVAWVDALIAHAARRGGERGPA